MHDQLYKTVEIRWHDDFTLVKRVVIPGMLWTGTRRRRVSSLPALVAKPDHEARAVTSQRHDGKEAKRYQGDDALSIVLIDAKGGVIVNIA